MGWICGSRRRTRLGVALATFGLIISTMAPTASAAEGVGEEPMIEEHDAAELPGIVAAFAVADTIYKGVSVQFEDRSSDTGWYWWNFGDGTTSTEQSPVHTFTRVGNHRVHFAVCASQSDCDRTSELISVRERDPDPELLIAFAPSPPSTGEEIRFISRITSPVITHDEFAMWRYEWDFGDGESSTERYPTHTYDAAGEYTATLTACRPNSTSCLPTESTSVAVAADPVVHPGAIVVGVSPIEPQIGDSVLATVTSPDIEILGSFFLFEESRVSSPPGNPVDFEAVVSTPAEQLVVAVCYVAPAFHCQLIERALVLEEPAPLGTIGNPAVPGDLKAFALGEGTRLEWVESNRGEGSYEVLFGADLQSLDGVYVYPADTQAIMVTGGSRCFKVRVRYAGGVAGPWAETCRVEDRESEPLPVTNPNWIASPTQPRAGEEVTFLARPPTVDGVPVLRPDGLAWDFGDGTPDAPANLVRTHVYDEPGSYTVSLLGCDECATATRSITVRPADAAEYDNGLVAPTGLSYLGWQGHPTELRWTDTNSDEDRYEVYTSVQPIYYNVRYGIRVSTPANTNRVSFSDHPISDYDQMCYEVRAMRGYEVGPAATVCDDRASVEFLELTAEQAPNAENATLSITAVVDSAGLFYVDYYEVVGGEYVPCADVFSVDRDAFEYELADAAGRVVRHYTVELPGSSIGDAVDVAARGINVNESACGSPGESIVVTEKTFFAVPPGCCPTDDDPDRPTPGKP